MDTAMRLSLPPAVRSGRRAASGMLTVDRVTQLRTIATDAMGFSERYFAVQNKNTKSSTVDRDP
jgi:hypothetical protein